MIIEQLNLLFNKGIEKIIEMAASKTFNSIIEDITLQSKQEIELKNIFDTLWRQLILDL